MPNLRLMAGRALETVENGKAGVTATVLNERGQRESFGADGLVGADGIWSQVRQQTGDRGMPAFTGFEAWRTLVPSDRVPGFLRQPAVALWLGAARHAVNYPVAGSRLINLVVIRRATAARQGWSTAADAGDLAETASDAAGPLRDLIGAAPGWQVWSLHDRLPAAMAKGAIALVGDAAHPVLPFMAQGAALAIEDAAVLARTVAEACAAGRPMTMAFRTYADARRARARRIHATARDNASHYHLSKPWSLARDLVLRRSSPERLLARYRWIYGWRDG